MERTALERLKAVYRRLRQPFEPPRQPTEGLYAYDRQRSGERSRLHLRLDPDGSGLLIVNANQVMQLNETAAYMAWLALEETPQSEAVAALVRRYQVPYEAALCDYTQVESHIELMTWADRPCPIHDLDSSSPNALLALTPPFSARPSAPYRMDLALTYRCNNDCAHCYNARPRSHPEISTESWFKIIDQVWQVGIPHVVFTGGEPTLRPDLPELIAHAERNGKITGLNTNARRLSDPKYVQQLVDAGLDHVQITLESHNPEIHDEMVRARGAWKQTVQGLQNVLESPLYVMTNTTLLRSNSLFLSETLDYLANLGVPTIGLNALIYSGQGKTVGTGLSERELPALLDVARQKTDAHEQRLIWYTPTQYCHFDPMQMELGVKGCTAALYNMCVEPDGAVIPCQSYYQSIGNLLSDEWQSIWNHDLAVWLRERKYIAEKCNGCALLAECGGGCPLLPEQS